jgi:hypothetical protein
MLREPTAIGHDQAFFELATFDHEEKLREIDEKRLEIHEKP